MRKAPSLASVMSRYWRVEDAERVLDALEQSGLSVSMFAREHGVNERRLLRWRRRLKEAQAPRFHPVKVVTTVQPLGESPIELVLVGGERLVLRRGFDPILLREVLGALEARGC